MFVKGLNSRKSDDKMGRTSPVFIIRVGELMMITDNNNYSEMLGRRGHTAEEKTESRLSVQAAV